jgi:hypothetical protein
VAIAASRRSFDPRSRSKPLLRSIMPVMTTRRGRDKSPQYEEHHCS